MSDDYVAKHEGPRPWRPPDRPTDDEVRRALKLCYLLMRCGVLSRDSVGPLVTADLNPLLKAVDEIGTELADLATSYDIERAYGYHPPDEPCENPDVDPTQLELMENRARTAEHARDAAQRWITQLEEANGNQATTIADQRKRIADLEAMLAGKLAIAEADPVFERIG